MPPPLPATLATRIRLDVIERHPHAAPIVERVCAALDTPVPYAPSLEDAFLPSEADVLRAARLLAAY